MRCPPSINQKLLPLISYIFFTGFKHFTVINVLGRVLGVFEIFWYGVNILFGGVEINSKCIYGNL